MSEKTIEKNALSLRNIAFSYENAGKKEKIIDGFSLDVEEGSFTTLLGSSGCGKTTLLRLISGFLKPDSGTIEIDGVDQGRIEPNKRAVGMVFQDYALFPHMTVRQNIEYGLKIKGGKKSLLPFSKKSDSIEEKVVKISDKLSLHGLLGRYPDELSGGQQQRVALARALVLNPKILLMDEPLSSLDKKMRETVRGELKEIQKRLGVTTVYVTHDQEEALSLSDKIAVIDKGKIMQYGSPKELYFKPQNRFVADFVGKANFIEEDGRTFVVRPEWFTLVDGDDERKGGKIIQGRVLSSEFLGQRTRFVIESGSQRLTVDLDSLEAAEIQSGSIIKVCFYSEISL